jgi:hypothetical protein
MSKITLVSPISGTAEFSITTPSGTSTDRTLTLPDNSGTVQTELTNGFGFRNRIINGDMRIDQRNAGASVTPTNGQYLVDRFFAIQSVASKYSAQQNAGAVTPPTGFSNYQGVTSLSAYSAASGDQFYIAQRIEASNIGDLAWGTANAQAVTLSFKVRSSLAGTHSGSIINAPTFNRSYPFTFTVNAANTWEEKTVVIPGDTSGTWATSGTGAGLQAAFNLGCGSSFVGTAGAWNSNINYGVTGSVSVVGTSGATFYITGVQLEAGSVATAFERRPYGTELQLCQRYYTKSYEDSTAIGAATYIGSVAMFSLQANRPFLSYTYSVPMRASATVTIYNPSTGAAGSCFAGDAGVSYTVNIDTAGQKGFRAFAAGTVAASGAAMHYTASAEI